MSDLFDTEPNREECELEERELEKNGLQFELTRRRFVQTAGVLSAAAAVGLPGLAIAETPTTQPITLKVNGKSQSLSLDSSTSLLDALARTHGSDRHQEGLRPWPVRSLHGFDRWAPRKLLPDAGVCRRRAPKSRRSRDWPRPADPKDLSELHPMQAAFLEHDGYQCGYCTPGQICSAVAAVEEQKRGALSIVSLHTGKTDHPDMTDDEIRERMSGNICRCGAYPNIVAAVRAASRGVSA